MDNKRAADRSMIFLDDKSEPIEKRCYLLLCGETDHTDYLVLE